MRVIALACALAGVAACAAAPGASANTGTLQSVSCTGPSTCVAVGFSTRPPYPTNYTPAPIAEALSGDTWSRTPVPSDDDADLVAVACPSSTVCEAVGENSVGAAAERYENGAWRAQTVSRAFASARFSGVSCVTTTWCIAVGTLGLDHGVFAARLDGSKWSLQALPRLPSAAASGAAVACASRRFCVMTGSYGFSQQANVHPLSEIFDGTSWKLARVPVTAGQGLLDSVSCPSVGNCVAVGIRKPFADTSDGVLTARYGAGHWTQLPDSQAGKLASFFGVSCQSTTTCLGVGTSGTEATFAQQLSGNQWSPTALPPPGGSITSFFGTSCAQTSCIAVGSEFTGAFSDGPSPLSASFSAGVWSPLSPAL